MAHINTPYGGYYIPQDLSMDKISPQKMFVDNPNQASINYKAFLDHVASITDHVVHLTCTTSGTVHALTGIAQTILTGVAPCIFKADANYVIGDTFTVMINGATTTFTTVTSGGEVLRSNAFLLDSIVYIILDIANSKMYIRQDNAAQIGSATTSTLVYTTLTAAGWAGTSATYTQTLSIAAVTATSVNEYFPTKGDTDGQREAFKDADLDDGGQVVGSMTLKAHGDKPTIDIPITVIVRGDL